MFELFPFPFGGKTGRGGRSGKSFVVSGPGTGGTVVSTGPGGVGRVVTF